MTVIRRREGYAEELLRRHKEDLMVDIDAHVGRARMAGRTISEGQDVVYALKETEARDLLANPRPNDPEQVMPFLSAEAAATSRTMVEIATGIVAAAEAERKRLAQLEGLRMGVKDRIKHAVNRADAEAARDAFEIELSKRSVVTACSAINPSLGFGSATKD